MSELSITNNVSSIPVIPMNVSKSSDNREIKTQVAQTSTSAGDTSAKSIPANSESNSTINPSALEKFKSQLEAKDLTVSYTQDKSGKQVMEIKDKLTQEVIRQIPSKEQLAISEAIDSFLSHYKKDGSTSQPVTSILREG